MSELEETNGPVPRDEAHARWLAMQSAYAEYMRASEEIETTRELTGDLAGPEHCELTLLEGRRDAFERYLEARLEFLERRFDEGYRREAAAIASRATRETGGSGTCSWRSGPKWLKPDLA